MKQVGKPALGTVLADDAYVRTRLRPALADQDCLVLEDIHSLVAQVAANVSGQIFDYGCGGAPYATLFEQATGYIRADVTAGPKVDRLLQENGLTTELSGSYDFLLSTQVLEHVKHPGLYVAECLRILKPGGRLLLTTHGMFEEHGCPYDFFRWTSRGLDELVASQGFDVLESYKLTTEVRAFVLLLNRSIEHLRCQNAPLWNASLALVRGSYRRLFLRPFNWVGRRFAAQGVVPGSDPSTLYVGVGLLAQKPY